MSDFQDQSLVDHLKDLKKCLQNSLLIIVLGFVGCLFFKEQIFDFIRMPIAPYLTGDGLVFTAPIDKFMAYIKVSFLAAAIVTCPLWLYQVWQFIAPGLYRHEKKMAVSFIFFGTLLFLAGVAFVYNLVFPMAFKYLLSFGGTTDKPMITISEYLSFFITTTLLFGLAFEMPLVLVIFAMLGIIDDEFLSQRRRIAIFIMAALSAIITPPDAVSMLAMLLPLVVLYEISILVIRHLVGKRQVAI